MRFITSFAIVVASGLAGLALEDVRAEPDTAVAQEPTLEQLLTPPVVSEDGRPLTGPAGPPPAADSSGEKQNAQDLADYVDLRLRPTRASAGMAPGRRLGHGDVVVSLPLSPGFQLRAGVRVDYDTQPLVGEPQMEGTPTVGIGLRF